MTESIWEHGYHHTTRVVRHRVYYVAYLLKALLDRSLVRSGNHGSGDEPFNSLMGSYVQWTTLRKESSIADFSCSLQHISYLAPLDDEF